MKQLTLIFLLLACNGCTVCVQNRVFPKLAWYWSHDAQLERQSRAEEKKFDEWLKTHTNSPAL